MIENRNPRCDLFAVVLLVLIVFLSVSLLTYDIADPVAPLFKPLNQYYQADVLYWPQNEQVQNACGDMGAQAANFLYTTLGIGAWYMVLGMAAVALALLHKQSIQSMWSRWVGWLLSLIGLTTLSNMLFPMMSPGPIIGPGGYLGALGAGILEMNFAGIGGLILATSVLLIGLFMWTEYILIRAVGTVVVSLVSVFAFMLPSGSPSRVRQWFKLRSRTDTGDDEIEEVAETNSGGRPSIVADLDVEDLETMEYEDEEEEEDDEWEEEDVDDDPQTIPFVVKTAASSATASVENDIEDDEEEDEDDEDEEEPVGRELEPRRKLFRRKRKPEAKPKPKPVDERTAVMTRLDAAAARQDEPTDYDLPAIDMLAVSPRLPDEHVRAHTLRRGKLLEQKFQEFGYKVKVVDIDTGPVITQYELELETGLRLSRIMGLSDDIAIGLRVPSVRIVAPIPGKNSVGIEVPNESRQMVQLRDVMEASTEQTRKMKIPLFLGQDVSGNTVVVDLAKLPHLLIAGRTGTGKSVCLNAIITSILMTRRPDEVRMLMIDPKMVELSGYSRLPHLMHPVVTDMKKAEAILAWAVEKMEERYKLMARAGVRHLNSYNQLGEEELMERFKPADDEERAAVPINMPFIVIVADEMADLMMTAGKEVESHIIRLAQKSRAVGIHLVLATQKPTVDVVTGLIKSNLPARISFQVASQMDSRVVLDANGAEKLLGNGDMLFLGPGTSTLLRGQGTFVSDDEIDSITETVSTGEQNFVNELVNMQVEGDGDGEDFTEKLKNRDELYHRAVETVITEDRGSVSLLQRCLGIGYGRAARLIDFMEEDGVVGPYNGSKLREIIMTMDQWLAFKSGEASSGNAESGNKSAMPGFKAQVPAPSMQVVPVDDEVLEEESEDEVDAEQDGWEETDSDEWEDEEEGDGESDEEEWEEDGEEDDVAAAATDEWEEEEDPDEEDDDEEWEYEYVDEEEEAEE